MISELVCLINVQFYLLKHQNVSLQGFTYLHVKRAYVVSI